MEPDFDRILSRKIRQVEQRPVSWNKQLVWRNVESQTSTRKHYHFMYYIAAAMISFLIYFAVQPHSNEIQPQVTDAKMKSRSTPIESETPLLDHQKQDYVPDKTYPVPDNTTMIAETQPRKRPRESTQQALPEIQNVDAIAEPVVDTLIPKEDHLSPEVVMVPERKIRPIVGIITESYSEDVVNVKRKKRLRKLAPSDQLPWEDPGNALVFAVKK